ncbi:MAG: hypothetical protein NTY38_22060 [Acidobacteria bacterium]|nr:hypothetical protein [Acidobacteriota bacterium]
MLIMFERLRMMFAMELMRCENSAVDTFEGTKRSGTLGGTTRMLALD